MNSFFNPLVIHFTFNFYLDVKQEVYHETGETLSYSEFKSAFNGLTDHPELKWLKVPASCVLFVELLCNGESVRRS